MTVIGGAGWIGDNAPILLNPVPPVSEVPPGLSEVDPDLSPLGKLRDWLDGDPASSD